MMLFRILDGAAWWRGINNILDKQLYIIYANAMYDKQFYIIFFCYFIKFIIFFNYN